MAKKKSGRKPMGKEGRIIAMAFKFSENEKKAIQDLATDMEMTVSEVIRMLIMDGFMSNLGYVKLGWSWTPVEAYTKEKTFGHELHYQTFFDRAQKIFTREPKSTENVDKKV